MSNSTVFNPKAAYIVRKPFRCNGKDYKTGDIFKNNAVGPRKMSTLYNTRFLMFPWEWEKLQGKQDDLRVQVNITKGSAEIVKEENKEDSKVEDKSTKKSEEESPKKEENKEGTSKKKAKKVTNK